MGFTNPEDLHAYMYSQVPSHSYYSTAYYRHPKHPLMADKEWLGAELIFDLDADHLENADQMTYAEMMIQIRGEMISLVDDFLIGDLGFREDQIHLCFSGGRGYHAHVRSPEIFSLGTHERRELVDYITCQGLDIDRVFPIQEDPIGVTVLANGTSRPKIHKYRLLPSPEQGGWRRRMRNALKETCAFIEENDPKTIRKTYPSIKGSKNSSIYKLSEDLKSFGELIFQKNSMGELQNFEQDILIKIMSEDVSHRLAGEVDKPVTPDIKRLIRLPGSLHGKTGLRVVPITREQLTEFDPLQYAVPDVYTDSPVKITMHSRMELKILDQNLNLEGETEVPEYAAAFLIGRKYADFGWTSENIRHPLL